MKKYFNNFNFLLLVFFLINLLQAIFTPIARDEAYYWVYSQSLAWGYFDHPPIISLLIKMGTLIFKGVLGVRFMTVILMTFSLFLIWQLIPESNKNHKNAIVLFFLLIFSCPVFNIYGFITTPDVPLIFFAVVYLFVFQKFTKNATLLNTLLLGLVSALLIYSKYHGGILILISIISHIKILKRYNIYLAGLIALLLIIPHILWQYNNNFVTFDYHLNQRTDGSFNIQNIGDYLLGAFSILNPALLILIIIFTFKKKVDSSFNKTLIFTLWGFLLFFLIYSCRGRIEAQWIAVSAIPLIILLHNLILTSEKLFKTAKIIAVPSIIILLIARVVIVLPLPLKTEFHLKQKPFYEAINKAADEEKVAFVNSYQNAAKYYFYTGDIAFSFNQIDYRKNQYDVGDYEDDFNNKKVFLVGNWPSSWFDTLALETGDSILFKIVERFPLITKLNIEMENVDLEFENTVEDSVDISITNPYNYDIIFNSTDLPFRLQLLCRYKNEKYFINVVNQSDIDTLPANSTQKFNLKFIPQDIPVNEYSLIFTISPGYLYPQAVSGNYKVKILN
jgi:hypothetical protein